MAVFNLDSVGNLDSANDLKQVKSYLFKLQEQLKYMFANLNPDDNNAAGVPKLTYARDENGEAIIEVATDGISIKMLSGSDVDERISAAITVVEGEISAEVSRATGAESSLSSRITVNAGQIALKVNSSDLGNSSLTIKPAKIELATTGQLVISAGNLTIDQYGNATFSGALNAATGTFSGNLSAAGGTFTGTLSAGVINGSVINGSSSINCGDDFKIINGTHGYEAYLGAFSMQYDAGYNDETFQSAWGTIVLMNTHGNIICNDVYPQDSWWKGWTLTEVCEELWDITH